MDPLKEMALEGVENVLSAYITATVIKATTTLATLGIDPETGMDMIVQVLEKKLADVKLSARAAKLTTDVLHGK